MTIVHFWQHGKSMCTSSVLLPYASSVNISSMSRGWALHLSQSEPGKRRSCRLCNVSL